jgi:uncharacterized membrane protein
LASIRTADDAGPADEVEPDAEAELDVDDDGTPQVPRWRPIAAFVLSIVGFGISMYLTIDHFSGVLPICSSSGFVNCTAVTTSAYSYIFGVPVSLLGLIFYTVMVGVNVPPLWRSRFRLLAWGRLALVVSGIAFVLYLFARELFSIKAICLWCTGDHIVTFLVFILVVMSFPAMSGRAPAWEEWDEDGDDGLDVAEVDQAGPA